ncbi:hypothetical protein DYB32_000442 [Aphanomyces invadans]|uniref:Uncharacterized protein n=1 Tax=Aphanomyces invadans TaxID=157072 RepID=A0A3R6VI63_9STRA|nr:hypothetical protein DYB32_000442 [Aphanomyces invadans]
MGQSTLAVRLPLQDAMHTTNMPTESKDARDDRDDDDDAKGSCRSNHVDSKGADDDYDEDDNIVTKVMTYFFENQEFNQAFQDFAERECDVFDTEDEAEMKLECAHAS